MQNNLYGGAESKDLPWKDIRWLTREEIDKLDVANNYMKWHDNQTTGWILEVTMKYSPHLHALHNSFPLAPENVVVDETMLSDYSRECQRVLHGKEKFCEKKLTATFFDRKHYVLSHQVLQTYLSLGLELQAVHKVLQFTQAPLFKPFINTCTELRSKTTSPYRKQLYKFIANR